MSLSIRFHHCLPAPQSQSASSTASSKLSREITSARGTLPFLRPTHAHVHFDSQKLDWNSRDHRKGRHPLPQGQRRRISTVLKLEWWNISWWVALVNPLSVCFPFLLYLRLLPIFPFPSVFFVPSFLTHDFSLASVICLSSLILVLHGRFSCLDNKRLLCISSSSRCHARNE